MPTATNRRESTSETMRQTHLALGLAQLTVSASGAALDATPHARGADRPRDARAPGGWYDVTHTDETGAPDAGAPDAGAPESGSPYCKEDRHDLATDDECT